MRNSLITAVEITDAHIKYMQGILHSGCCHLVQCQVKQITQHSDEEISKTLAEFSALSKNRPEHVIAVVPRRFAIQRHIQLPSHDEEEIKKMVALQIIKRVPYPKEDIVVDYTVLNKDPSGYVKVLVVAVHKDVIGRYLKIFRDAGLHLNRLTLSSQGLLNFFLSWEQRRKENAAEPTAVINLDHMHAEICFFHQQKLLFSRSIHHGARDLSEDGVSAFVHQVHLTFSAYNKEKISKEVSKVLLFSPLSEIPVLKEGLEAEGKVTIDVIDPFQEVPLKKKIQFPQIILSDGVAMTVGLGLLLAGSKKMMNLLPAEVRDTRQIKQRKRHWIKLVILAMTTFIVATAAFSLSSYKKSLYIKQLEKKLKETEEGVSQVKGKSHRLDILREKLGSQIPVIIIMDELYNRTPSDISYRMVFLEASRALTLQGVSKDSAQINELQKGLVQSPLFENVTLQYATKRKAFKGQELTDFKITCQVSFQADINK